jgi:CENP-B N-terminal DNA-binding domain
MTFTISNVTRSIVIQQYLRGKSRDDIARDCGLGAGTVSNIIAGWKANLDQYVVEDLRELGINLKKSAISPAQCARGSKIISTLERLGVNEDNFENFISSTYLQCRRIDDLAPHKIASYIEDLIAFSKTVPFSQIEQHIEEKKNENTKLEDYKRNLESQIQELQKEEANSKTRRDAALYK